MQDLPDAGDLQALCDRGQTLLERMEYLAAEAVLVEADHLATTRGDFDTLARLYMPLQEARRQRRQRCGEGRCGWTCGPRGRMTRSWPGTSRRTTRTASC